MRMNSLRLHPITRLFPQMTDAELDRFILDQQNIGKRALYGPTVEGEIEDNGGESS